MCPNGSYIKLNSPSVEFLPTADYSVEFWAKVPFDSQFAITSPVDTFILELIVESTVVRHRRSGMLMQPNIGDGSGSVVGRWVHAFAGRKSGIDYVACNGVMTSNSSNPYTLTSLADLYIGMFNYPGSPAYIQDLRYIVGDCAYTASFTPPAAPYTL